MKFPLLAAVVLLFSVTALQAASRVPLRLCTDGDLRDGGASGSMFPQDGKAILARLGTLPDLDVTIRAMPWRRCLADVVSGHIDGAFAVSATEERRKAMRFPSRGGQIDTTRRLYSFHYRVYRLKGHAFVWNTVLIQDKGQVIGVPGGYSMGGTLRRLGIEVDDGAPDISGNLRKLVQGRVQAVVLPARGADALIRSNAQWSEQIEATGRPFQGRANYLVFSHDFYRQHTALAEVIWQRVARLPAAGQ